MIATTASAQTPSPPATTEGGSLSGVVRDVSGAALPDVYVTLLGEAAATRSDGGGHFAMRNLSPGNHTALFRRIGYGSVEHRWIVRPGNGPEIDVIMAPVARQLDRIIVEAPGTSRRRGTSSIGGIVIDSGGGAVRGADVRLLGSGMSSVTDSTGRFEFGTLAAGSYIVRARRRGLAGASYVMQIADADARGVTLKMYGLPRKASARDSATVAGYGVADAGFDAFDRRERSAPGIAVLGPADLFRAGGATMEFVLQRWPLRVDPTPRAKHDLDRRGAVENAMATACSSTVGAQPTSRSRSFTTRELQLVEVIGTNATADGFVISQMEGIGECRGSADRHPTYFVLWTRALR